MFGMMFDMFVLVATQGGKRGVMGDSHRYRFDLLEATRAAPLPAEPLVVLRGANALRDYPSDDLGLECLETEGDQYSSNAWEACWRVLISNPPSGAPARRARIFKLRELSVLGLNGHLERSNAWTHLIGAALFLIFSVLRPFVGLDTGTIAGQLSGYSSLVVVLTFGVSTLFHVGSSVRWMAPVLRVFDHGAIDVALALAAVTDIAVVTLGFDGVPWQTIADPLGVAAVILLFFVYRRVVTPPSVTEVGWGDCVLGLFRVAHTDREYGALRSAGYIILSFGFVSLIPCAVRNLGEDVASVLLICNGVSLLLLIGGMALDNLFLWPDLLYKRPRLRAQRAPQRFCNSTACGCVMSSHAWWHVFSVLSVALCTFGREYAISQSVL